MGQELNGLYFPSDDGILWKPQFCVYAVVPRDGVGSIEDRFGICLQIFDDSLGGLELVSWSCVVELDVIRGNSNLNGAGNTFCHAPGGWTNERAAKACSKTLCIRTIGTKPQPME